MRVAVVGGGITGLAAAHRLRRFAPDLEVTLYEASDRLGGKLHTVGVGDLRLEAGADAFLTREPDAERLCRDVGLGDDLVRPAVRRVEVALAGRRHPLPDGLVMGAPTRFGPLLRCPLLSTRGALRAALDLVLPRTADADRGSVAALIERRFGREVLDRLVDPLLAGVHAGDPGRLGVDAAAPRLAEAARAHRSLARGLRRTAAGDEAGARFRTLRDGLSTLVERLAEGLDVAVDTPVGPIGRDGGRFALPVPGGRQHRADAVIAAVPAGAAADLLRDVSPAASDAARAIVHVSVATVITVHRPGTLEVQGSGLLVPDGEAQVVKAVTYVSNKWPHLVPDERVVLRSSVGRRGHEDPVGWPDRRLASAVLGDLRDLLGVAGAPTHLRIARWADALPQYEVGHLERVALLERTLADQPRVAVAGAAYRGVGIPACVRDGQRAADRVVAGLSRPG